LDMGTMLTKLHDGALAEASLNLGHSQLQRLLLLAGTGTEGDGGDTAVYIVTGCRHACLLSRRHPLGDGVETACQSVWNPSLNRDGLDCYYRGRPIERLYQL